MRRSLVVLFVALALVVAGAVSPVWAGDPVAFSGKVKKVTPEKNKVGIHDQENKKRFTVVIAESSKLTGYSGIGDIKKGDQVAGHYEVDAKGLYIVTDLEKK